VLVTGGSRGIGRVIARSFAERGDRVAVHFGSSREQADEALAELPGSGHVLVQADMADADAVGAMVDDAAERLGGLDVLVNNAGTGDPTGDFLELSYEEWRQVIDTNLSGAFLCSQRAARRMVDAGNGGRIINITSVHEHIPRTGASAYCASKGGLGLLTKVMAMELAQHGITVNAIAPGEIATPMTGAEDTDPTTIERPNLPLGRPGHAREIAAWVAFLASERSSYATGASFVVDGGLMLMAAELTS
jgi:NAD(P)-dependent dehydrogenase (short-subunit alcohol dehydrogenase family)